MSAQADSSLDSSYANQVTLTASESILERLRRTEQFSEEQLELIQAELTRFFDGEQLSSGGWLNLQSSNGLQIGDYVIESLLGEGGAGNVFRARSSVDASPCVAIKLIKNAKANARFRREMELVQRLAHPNVVVAYEVGEHQSTLYIVMEELAGPDLQQFVTESGPIGWEDTIALMLDAAAGLEHAHQRGLVHRDVKPGNLMFDGNRIKVTDLGLAVLTEDAEDARSVDVQDSARFRTRSEFLVGTPDFMAPEQARDLSSANVQSDIYALGASWYFLLTGQTRLTGKSIRQKVVNLIRGVGLDPLADTVAPLHVRSVCEKMLAYRPEDRYRSMSDVTAALHAIAPFEPLGDERNCIDALIVEDDHDDLQLTIEMLQRGNKAVNVKAVRTLGNAIEAYESGQRFDVVLLDLRLPDSLGVDTVTTLREHVIEVPIIVLTGQDDIAIGRACIAAGADDYACKNDLTPHLLERIIFVTLSRYSRKATSDSIE